MDAATWPCAGAADQGFRPGEARGRGLGVGDPRRVDVVKTPIELRFRLAAVQAVERDQKDFRPFGCIDA